MNGKPFRVIWRTNLPEPTGWIPLGTPPANPLQYNYFDTLEDAYDFMLFDIRLKNLVGVPYYRNEDGYWIPLPQTLEEYREYD